MGILPIVEGQSEVESIRVLISRIMHHTNIFTEILKPFRVKRNQIVKTGELERAVDAGIRTRANVSAIIVLLDADDDDPDMLRQQLLERLGSCLGETVDYSVVIANKELECWFLSAKESLSGVRGIRTNAVSPSNPESIRAAKGHLTRNMDRGFRYNEVDDQPAFAYSLDMDAAREKSPSFRLFVSEVERLIR